jgi:predicted dehydrogenase
LLALREIPGILIGGGCDPDKRCRDFVFSRWGIATYASISELLDATQVDVAHILVPPFRHVEVALECLSRGCHVFMEKPMGISSSECRVLGQAATASRCTVGVNHNQRWNPAFVSLLKKASKGYLGQIKNVFALHCIDTPLVRGNWAVTAKCNSVLELGPHPLSLIIELLGPVREALAQPCQMKTLSERPVVSSWQASLLCETGSANCFVSIGDTYQECSILVVGEDGSARVDLQRNLFQIWTKSQFSLPLDNLFSTLRTGSAGAWRALGNFVTYASSVIGVGRHSGDVFSLGIQASLADFYSALRGGYSPLVGFPQGEHVVQACEKIVTALEKCGR